MAGRRTPLPRRSPWPQRGLKIEPGERWLRRLRVASADGQWVTHVAAGPAAPVAPWAREDAPGVPYQRRPAPRAGYAPAVRLVKWQRNAIFEAVVAGGLDASECTLDYDDTSWRITHVPSGSYFLLEGNPGHYNGTAVVGDAPPWPSESYSWGKVEERVQGWAEDVKRDVDTPDLWAELQRELELVTSARYDDIENTPFTPDEQAEIAEQLRQLKDFLKEKYALSEAQTLSLEARFDDLEAAAGRIGRKDWRLLFLGGILTLVVGVSCPQTPCTTSSGWRSVAWTISWAAGVGRRSCRPRRRTCRPWRSGPPEEPRQRLRSKAHYARGLTRGLKLR